MADPKDVEATRVVRKEFIKHRVDTTMADLRVSHGVVYIRGLIKREKGAAYVDLKTETERIARIIRQRPGIRDVVIDCQYRNF